MRSNRKHTTHTYSSKKFKKTVCAFTFLTPVITPLLCAAVLLLLFSCAIPGKNSATLVLSISEGYSTKTLVPDFDMVPVHYDVSGSGPNGEGFSVTANTNPVEIPFLDFGEWTVNVSAKNAENAVVATGIATTFLHVGERKELDITVRPIEGHGTLELTVYWTASDVETPSIEAQLIPQQGTTADLQFTIPENGTATFTDNQIPTGYYTLVIQLCDNGLAVMGAVDVVRIINGQTTSGIFEFYEVNNPGGDFSITISPEMNDPLEVYLNGQVDEVGVGETIQIEASVQNEPGEVEIFWYVNGQSAGTGALYTGENLQAGVYRLDAVAFSADGSRSGSATHSFRVSEGTTTEVSLLWDQNTEPDLAGYKVYYGLSSRNYDSSFDVGNQTTCTLTDLEPGTTYYIAATAYNTQGLESDFSNEVTFCVQ
jgi:hypothetical protein